METIKTKTGIRYKEKIYLAGGRTITKSFDRKTDARTWKHRHKLELQKSGATGIALRPALLLSDAAQLWLERKVIPFRAPKTAQEYQNTVRKYIVPMFGKRPMGSLTTNEADQLVQLLLARNRAPKTINKILGIFKQLVGFAAREGIIGRSPLSGYPQLKVDPRSDEYLLAKEVQQLLLKTVGHPIHSVILIAVNTGMRLGEICGLKFDRVNFETGLIEVTRNMTRNGLVETTKTNQKRYVPLNDNLHESLKALMWKQNVSGYVCVSEKGTHYKPDHFCSREFGKALEVAGVRKIRFHDLRHTFASHFMMNGGNIYDLQKILGHTKIEMTMKYAHLSPLHLKKAGNVVSFFMASENSKNSLLASENSGSSPYLALARKSEGT